MELEYERLKSQALNHRALNLIKRWHEVGAVIQQKKRGKDLARRRSEVGKTSKFRKQ